MQMQTGIRALNERLDDSRSWMAEQEALRDEWSAETAGVTLPALVGFTDSLATVRRELDAAVEDVEALERWSAAIEALGDAPERERYMRPYNAALGALERHLSCDGPVIAATNETLRRVEAAKAEAEAEIERRYHEAARKEAARQEAEERRKAEERKRNALAEAEAAQAALAGAIPGSYILEYAAGHPHISVRGDRTWHRKHPERAIARGSA